MQICMLEIYKYLCVFMWKANFSGADKYGSYKSVFNISIYIMYIYNKSIFCFTSIFIFIKMFIVDFDGYYIVRTDECQPRPKYISIKCGTNI